MTGGSPTPEQGKCGAKKRQGTGYCTRPAGWGTPTPGTGKCKLHFGSTGSHQAAARKQLAHQAVIRFGLGDTTVVDADPRDLLAEELWRTALAVHALDFLVSQLPHHPPDDVFVPPTVLDGGERDGEISSGRWDRGEPGIYGRTYHVSGLPTGEAKPHVLWSMWQAERAHLARVAGECVKAGVETRRVEIEQQHAQLMADVLRAVFADPELGLDSDRRRVALGVAARHLRLAA